MRKEKEKEMHGGKMWTKGETIGHRGNFGTVFLAMTKRRTNNQRSHLPSLMAVKSAEISESDTLQKEKQMLTILQGCPHIIRCYGEEFTTEKGEFIYNALLEYASGGNLAAKIKSSNGGLPESEVRLITRSILRGLNHIHERGYVHCNIKPQNILLVPISRTSSDYIAKISDFGCAKKTQQKENKTKIMRPCLRGTPLYMSPETVSSKEQEPPSDIWALGCVVAEMISGRPAWNCESNMDIDYLLSRIGSSRELPETPSGISKEGKDFLKRCFVRTSNFRWTAAMLLRHPFVAGDDEDVKETGEDFIALEELIEIKFRLIKSSAEEVTVGDLKRRRITRHNKSTTATKDDVFKILTPAPATTMQQHHC